MRYVRMRIGRYESRFDRECEEDSHDAEREDRKGVDASETVAEPPQQHWAAQHDSEEYPQLNELGDVRSARESETSIQAKVDQPPRDDQINRG